MQFHEVCNDVNEAYETRLMMIGVRIVRISFIAMESKWNLR